MLLRLRIIMEHADLRFNSEEAEQFHKIISELSDLKKDERLVIKKDEQGHWIPAKGAKPKGIDWLREKMYKPKQERIGFIDKFINEFIAQNEALIEENRNNCKGSGKI